MVVAKGGDEWRGNVRHVRNVAELHHVSVVSTPAYDASVAELRSAEQKPPGNPSEVSEPKPPEAPVPDTPPAGGLRVEDRQHHTTPKGTPEDRIMAAIAGVPPGEMRDLTHATAEPVEPDDLRRVLIDRFREASVMAAAGVPIVPTDKKNVVWPTLTGDITAAFYDELEEITESDPGLDEFEVPVKAIKSLTRMSSEAVEDSDPDLLRLVTTNHMTSLVLKGDRELLVGNDAKGFTGLMNLTGTQTMTTVGAISWDHIIKAVGMLVEALVPGPYAVLMGPRPLTALDLMKELSTGSNAYVGRPAGIPPVFQTGWFTVSGGASPKTSAVVFAPQQSMIVLRKSVVVEIDRSQEFTSDAVLARGRYRLGFGCPHPQSVVKLTGIDAPAIS
jgi:HK97 family phage major capsid protein